MTKGFLLPVRNSFSFLMTYARLDHRSPTQELQDSIVSGTYMSESAHILDMRILGSIKQASIDISYAMEQYDLV